MGIIKIQQNTRKWTVNDFIRIQNALNHILVLHNIVMLIIDNVTVASQ